MRSRDTEGSVFVPRALRRVSGVLLGAWALVLLLGTIALLLGCATTPGYAHEDCPSASVRIFNAEHFDGVDVYVFNADPLYVPITRAVAIKLRFCEEEGGVVQGYQMKVGQDPWGPVLPGDGVLVVVDRTMVPEIRIRD